MIKLAGGVALLVILIIFIFQNLQPTEINFLMWSFEGSLSLLLILTIFVTVSVSFLAAVPYKINRSIKNRKIKKQDIHKETKQEIDDDEDI